MNKLTAFFDKPSSWLGVFYPSRYLTAMFTSYRDAEAARGKLMNCGVGGNAVVVATSGDLIEFAEDQTRAAGLTGWVFRSLSRALGTEAADADRDLQLAHQGAAYLAVYCSTEREKGRIWTCLAPSHPISARHYAALGIEHFVGK